MLAELTPLEELGTIAADPVATVVATAASAVASNNGSSILPSWATRVLVIVLGLLLVAAGIFSFDKVKTTIVEAGRAAATAA